MKKLNFFLIFSLLFFTLRFFHHKIFTAILILEIIILFLLLRKEYKQALIFYVLMGIYLLGNYLNSMNFESLVPSNFNYSIVYECFQMLKLSIPLLFYLLIRNKYFSKVSHSQVIKWGTLFVGGSILILNIFKLSYSSYNDTLISGSVFDWWKGIFSYSELASKGWFIYGNQIALLLVLFFTYFLYEFVLKGKNYYYLVFIGIIGVIVGSRVSTLFPLLLFVMFILLNIGYKLIKKKKIEKKFCFQSIVFVIIMSIFICSSPMVSRFNIDSIKSLIGSIFSQKVTPPPNPIEVVEEEIVDKEDYILKNYKEKLINEQFLFHSYPYQYDPDFWIGIIKQPDGKRTNYRYLELSMVKRVYEINNNKMDYLFGIGSSRVYNIWNIEKDFIMQFYSFGIFGLLLIIYVYYLIIRDKILDYKKSKDIKKLLPLVSLLIFFAIAYLSGNILNSLSVTLMSIFVIAHQSKDN